MAKEIAKPFLKEKTKVGGGTYSARKWDNTNQ